MSLHTSLFPLPSLSFGSTESSSMAQEIVLPIGGSGGKSAAPFMAKLKVGLKLDNNSGSNEGRKMHRGVIE